MKFQSIIRNCLFAASSIALLGLLGRLLNIAYLASIVPGYPSMAVNSGVCILLLAASIWLIQKKQKKSWQPLVLILVVLLSPLSPGLSALCLLCLSIGLLLIWFGSFITAAQILFQITCLVAFINILGYIFDVSYLYRDTYFGSASLQSCIAFIILGIAASLLHPTRGFIRLFVGDEIGSTMTRRLFPAFTLVIVLLAILRIITHRLQIVNVEFGIALFATSFLLSMLFLVSNTAKVLNKVELQRKQTFEQLEFVNKNLEKTIQERTASLAQTVAQLVEKEAALSRNEKLMQGVINNTTTAIVIKNKEGQYLLCNQAFSQQLGYVPEQLIGKTAFDIFPYDIAIALIANEASIFETGKTLDYEEKVPTPAGDKFLHTNKFPIYDHQNNIYAICIVATDITNEKQTLVIQQELAEKLQARNNQLSNFAHITSHNLRAPVSNLVTLLELLDRTKDTEERDFLISKFSTVVPRLAATLNNLIESIRIQEDVNKERSELNIEAIFNTVKDLLSVQIAAYGVKITTIFKVKTIFYPRTYFESILLNLMSNAIKYRSPDRPLTITVTTDERDHHIFLIVEDNGLGIDLVKHGSKLFGLNKTFHRHREAKGVGLFLTKTQVEAMGGKIEVASEPNIGTKFEVQFKKNVL